MSRQNDPIEVVVVRNLAIVKVMILIQIILLTKVVRGNDRIDTGVSRKRIGAGRAIKSRGVREKIVESIEDIMVTNQLVKAVGIVVTQKKIVVTTKKTLEEIKTRGKVATKKMKIKPPQNAMIEIATTIAIEKTTPIGVTTTETETANVVTIEMANAAANTKIIKMKKSFIY